ncbi:hypothetical protein OsI_08903 [Oryza sativa Indica Group]|uniref:RING-type E3 ubiquitin transferase n=1 Tax=Oryza sativa subsp. indica TaxID=39946 RepID=B8AIF1_ORYSI|nr:hypothetical protein OsI_08903 [Oryza sativa Indica Group]
MVAAVAASLRSLAPLSAYRSPSHGIHAVVRDSSAYTTRPPPPPPTADGGGNGGRISPAVLFIIVILAVIFFISGLLHLLVRLLMKKQHRRGGAENAAPSPHSRHVGRDAAMDRQLQQLFHLHDSGLDQAFIDALPVFAYRDIVGGDKEPFDCAVCLCEFDGEDRLRLLPVCGHAFHLHCIDTWLLSNSTCPLCRGTLYVPGLTIESLMFDFDERLEEGRLSEECEDGFQSSRQKKPMDEEQTVTEKRVFPVRLGKFKNVGNTGVGGVDNGNAAEHMEGKILQPQLPVRKECERQWEAILSNKWTSHGRIDGNKTAAIAIASLKLLAGPEVQRARLFPKVSSHSILGSQSLAAGTRHDFRLQSLDWN